MRQVKIELTDDVYEELLEKAGKGNFAKFLSTLIVGAPRSTVSTVEFLALVSRVEELEKVHLVTVPDSAGKVSTAQEPPLQLVADDSSFMSMLSAITKKNECG